LSQESFNLRPVRKEVKGNRIFGKKKRKNHYLRGMTTREGGGKRVAREKKGKRGGETCKVALESEKGRIKKGKRRLSSPSKKKKKGSSFLMIKRGRGECYRAFLPP